MHWLKEVACAEWMTGCDDLFQMIDLLGVSKPILSHVIFCHQEESAW